MAGPSQKKTISQVIWKSFLGFFLICRCVSVLMRCCCHQSCDIVMIIVTIKTIVTFIVFGDWTVIQFLSGMKKYIYSNQYTCQGKLIAWQCFFKETLFKKPFDKEINQDDECLTRLALVTALTLAKTIFVIHRYAYLLQKIKLLQHSESQLTIWFVLTGHVCIPSLL